MRLSTSRRPLLALLLVLSAAALAVDLALRSVVDWDAPPSSAPLRVRHTRDLSFLRRPDGPQPEWHRSSSSPAFEPSSKPTRGLVLPLDGSNAQLALSLVLSLRGLGRRAAAVPVELAYCGEAAPLALRLAFAAFFPLGPVRFLDVCSSDSTGLEGPALSLAAVKQSDFDELLLIEAHALLFQDPTPLLDDEAFQTHGALFFPAARRSNTTSASSSFPDAGDTEDFPSSRFDSTLVAWNKRVQRVATASLAVSTVHSAAQSTSKLLATACESSNASFAVWETDAGVVGTVIVQQPTNSSHEPLAASVSLCGSLTQFAISPGGGRLRPLFLSGRRVLDELVVLNSLHQPPLIIFTASSSPLELIPSLPDGDECAAISSPASAASATAVAAMSKRELELIARRRQQHRHVVDWTSSVADWSEAELARSPRGLTLEDVVRTRVAALVASEEQLVYSVDQLAQHTPVARGVVLPLYDKIAMLGASLVLELRELGLRLPVEIAHCGDLSPKFSRSFSTLLNPTGDTGEVGEVRFYDVCALAAQEHSALFPSRPLFCRDMAECHRKFRGFDIKVLALVLSQFEEVLLLDADTLFFSDPTSLFDTRKFRDAGTLFFHDRISGDSVFMAQRTPHNPRLTVFHDYMLAADVQRFSSIPTLSRPASSVVQTASKPIDVLPPNPMELPFEPSNFLLASHTWNARAGFQMDSSCLLWSKKRQQRATAVLAAFIARNDERAPPSYGDKELFFVACELAETSYAFSDFGIGAVGTQMLDNGPNRSVLCGDMSQNVPEWAGGDAGHSPLLYINSDNILTFQPDTTPVFYSAPRLADEYPGRFPWQQECPFNVTIVPFSPAERARVNRRQLLHRETLSWLSVAVS